MTRLIDGPSSHPGDDAAANVGDPLLKLKNRALDAAAEGITIADARLPGRPLIYVNAGFEKLTGYRQADVIGRNCRFLQGPQSDPKTVATIRQAVQAENEVVVEILNYRRDGTPFWNRLSITPVLNSSGETTHFIGIQSDVTKRRRTAELLTEAREELERINQVMRGDLQAAAQVQQSMLPGELAPFPGVQFAWRFEPYAELSGDGLNILPLDDQHVACYLLDVAGHGAPSALLSVTLSHWLSAVPDQSCLFKQDPDQPDQRLLASPSEVIGELNRKFPFDRQKRQFFSILYGILHLPSGDFRFVCAGHPAAIYLPRLGVAQEVGRAGPAVGIGRRGGYTDESVQLAPGDRLFVVSDGVIESTNPRQEQFGHEGLASCLQRHRDQTLDGLLTAVTDSVDDWREGAEASDDLSILGMEILEAP